MRAQFVGVRTRRRYCQIALLAVAVMSGTFLVTGCASGHAGVVTPGPQQRAAASNPDVDPGTSLSGRPAPGFRLVNQFDQPMSLSQFRGKVVILAFADSRCTTICPLTSFSMDEARELLGTAADRVQLLAINANPQATAVADVMAYSRAHGMVNRWDFLTGTPAQLRAVWKAYHIYAQIVNGQIDHTPALYVIDQYGREQKIYLTAMAYAGVGQAAQILAAEAASLLPGHPKLVSQSSLAYLGVITPKQRTTLTALPSGTLALGPGRPRLVMFFATWLTETSDLRERLIGMNSYVRASQSRSLPQLVAIDEGATEPAGAARSYLEHLGWPLRYPVGIDSTGRLADGYGVTDQPWFVLISASGKILWKHDGWLPPTELEAAARRA
jgi:cytochrome oxidase Cu insertion factor (SCO1/SenC/PrrC family)